jgi:hypothetical protein
MLFFILLIDLLFLSTRNQQKEVVMEREEQ